MKLSQERWGRIHKKISDMLERLIAKYPSSTAWDRIEASWLSSLRLAFSLWEEHPRDMIEIAWELHAQSIQRGLTEEEWEDIESAVGEIVTKYNQEWDEQAAG